MSKRINELCKEAHDTAVGKGCKKRPKAGANGQSGKLSAFFFPDLTLPWSSGTGGTSFLWCFLFFSGPKPCPSGRFMPCFAI